jgi:hypothetical protein
MATAFHPELTADDRVHRYFVRMATGEEAVREPARLKKKAGVRP